MLSIYKEPVIQPTVFIYNFLADIIAVWAYY